MADDPPEAAPPLLPPAVLPRTRRAPAEVGKQLSAAETAALLRLADTVRAFSSGTPSAETPADEAAPPKGFRFQRHAAPPPLAGPAHAPARLSSPAPAGKASILRQHPILVWVAVQIFGLGLLAAGVFLGEWDARSPGTIARANEPAIVHPPPASARLLASAPGANPGDVLRDAGLAMTREDTGDLRSARTLLEGLAQPSVASPGAEYELALLDLRRGDRAAAGEHLARSIAAGQFVAPCRYLQGALAGLSGDFRQAAAQLRLAVQAEPFSGRYLFYLGEALRRAGQPKEAALSLQAALARPLTSEEWQLYYFKLRLAEVEASLADPHDPFAAELQAKLEQPSPDGDWLLLGAAQSVLKQGFINAAHYLKEASRQLPPPLYRTCVSDYVFQQYVSQVEIEKYILVPPPTSTIGGVLVALGAEPPPADLLPNPPTVPIAPPIQPPDSSPPPAASGLPDPTVCPASEADPALWKFAMAR